MQIVFYFCNFLIILFSKFRQLKQMAQTLQGNYYATTQNGYVNKGRQVIKIGAKINYLSVFSRCNLLLRSQNHTLKIENPKLQEVHCHINSLTSITNTSVMSAPTSPNKDVRSLSLQTPQISKKYKQNDQTNDQQKLSKLNLSSIMPFNLNSQKKSKNMFENNSKNDIKFQQQKQKISNTKSYENLKQPIFTSNLKSQQQNSKIKQKSLLDNMQDKIENQSISHVTYQFKKQNKKMKSLNPQEQNTISHQYDDIITQHAIYDLNRKNTKSQNTKQRVNQTKILFELQNQLNKIDRLQNAIKRRQNQFKQKLLEKKIKDSTQKIRDLTQENLLLRNKDTKICKSQNFTNQNHQCQKNSSFLLLFVFLIGILFTKAVLC